MTRRKWEHLKTHEDDADLEALGREGWELVAVTTRTWTNERKGHEEWSTVFYFKRPAD